MPFYFLLLFSCGDKAGRSNLEYGAVSTASPEATMAGMEVLRKGGNAADAAIAVSMVLGVTEPAMSGIGGGTQILIRLPGKSPFSINGSTISPAKTPVDFEEDSLKFYKRTTIPSTVKVLQYQYDNFGSRNLTWSELLQPSIQYASEGFHLGEFREKVYQKYHQKLEKGLPSTAELMIDTTTGKVVQPALAHTLKLLADRGADEFYRGTIAESISKDMAANGGWITLHDLNDFSPPDSVQSIHFTYKGYDVYTQPEPCGGWVVREILQKLEKLDEESEDHTYNVIQALDFGHEKRERLARSNTWNKESGETTHFSVLDSSGMSLSVTASINAYYGAGVANPDYGFLYNSYMDDFIFDDSLHKYAMGPGKMAYSSMSPAIVMENGQVKLIVGSPGSARIISTVAQMIDLYISGDFPKEKLLHAPRIHVDDGKVYFESEEQYNVFSSRNDLRWTPTMANEDLMKNGLNAYFGGVHAILATDNGFIALADPRRDGVAIAE